MTHSELALLAQLIGDVNDCMLIVMEEIGLRIDEISSSDDINLYREELADIATAMKLREKPLTRPAGQIRTRKVALSQIAECLGSSALAQRKLAVFLRGLNTPPVHSSGP